MKLEETLYCYVLSAQEQKGKFVNYVLNTCTHIGPLNFKFWDFKKKSSFPRVGDYLVVKITDIDQATSELMTYKTLSLDSTSKNKPYFCEHVVVNEEAVPPEIRRVINKDRSEQISFASKLLQDSSYWKDKKIYKFLFEFMKSNFDKFRTAPAAVSHHHNYRGGLLVHSSEVFTNCVAMVNAQCNAKFYQDRVNSDALYLSAWLHDSGKMEVYYLEDNCPKIDSDKENLVGHPTISNRLFLDFARNYDLDQNFIMTVSHCILSHHQRKEWGAVVEPQTLEAHILCTADFISSRIAD